MMTDTISKHKTILLIGSGKTKYKVGQVAYFTSSDHVAKTYGDCELTKAFALLKSLDCPHVFIFNTGGNRNLSKLETAIRDYDFTYIVPVDIKFSDSYYNNEEGKEFLVCGKLLDMIGPFGLSTVIMTDNHASLYEDVDAYLKDMLTIEKRVSSYLMNACVGHNLIFVGDVLTTGSSHIKLAASMCMTDLSSYPAIDGKPDTVFDIDTTDIGRRSFVYFRQRVNRTTIENLVNFNEKMSPERMADIDRILKYIVREINFSNYEGVTYSDSIRIEAEASLRSFLESLLGELLDEYEISDVHFEKSATIPGTGTLCTKFSVRPVGCSANCTLQKEV